MNSKVDVDPFTKTKNKKKETIKAEKKKQQQNEYRSNRQELKEKKDTLDENLFMRDKKKHNQEQIQSALKKAQKSTQSAGV